MRDKEPVRIALENSQLKRRLKELTARNAKLEAENKKLDQEYRELARFAVERDLRKKIS